MQYEDVLLLRLFQGVIINILLCTAANCVNVSKSGKKTRDANIEFIIET